MKGIKETRSGNTGIAVTRIVAFMAVPGVHFFLNSGFYNTQVVGRRMFVMMIIRALCIVCVPLFLLISGYLVSQKAILTDKESLMKYYLKLRKILEVYVLATIIIIFFRRLYLHEQIGVRECVSVVLGFQHYSWYVEMYIGLFFLTPFLNVLWKAIPQKGQRNLVILLIVLTVLPSIVNVYDWQMTESLIRPWLSKSYRMVVPDWWKNLYPITYYFIGAYLRENIDIKALNTSKLLVALAGSIFLCGGYNYWRCYSITFQWGRWCDWGSWQSTLNAVLLFLVINSISFEKIDYGRKNLKKCIFWVSDLTFGAYLISWIPDKILYPLLAETEGIMVLRLNYFPVVVLSTIIISVFLSWIMKVMIEMLQLPVKKRRTV